MHKLAMILAASRRDELIITVEDIKVACNMVTDLELEMPKVFDKIGMKGDAVYLERMLRTIAISGGIPMHKLMATFQRQFPRQSDFNEVLNTLVGSGHARLEQRNGAVWAVPTFQLTHPPKPEASSGTSAA